MALLGLFIFCCRMFPRSKYVVIRETIEVIRNTTLPVFYKIYPKSFTAQMPTASNGWEWKSTNGSIIKFFGVDISKDPLLDRLRGLEADSIGLEEMDVTKDVFDKAMERVGTWNMDERKKAKEKGLAIPPRLLLGTSNPRKDWVKEFIYDPWREGRLRKRWHYLPSKVFDNPHIEEAWIKEKEENMNPKDYLMFVEGDWDVDKNDEPFFQKYNDKKHYNVNNAFDFDPLYPVILSFDFNYNPTTVSIYQDFGTGIAGMRSYEAVGGTKNLCELIKFEEADGLMKVPKHMWKVTGDHSGTNMSSAAGSVTDYQIILQEFDLVESHLIAVHKRNRAHVYSRALCDYFLEHCPFEMDGRMKKTRDDLIKAKPTPQGALYKDRKKGYAMDHADNFRYAINALFPGGIEDIKTYLAIAA